MRHYHRSGFTLVELLAVIAVLGILAALLLTALTRGMGKARGIHCASNVRQLGQALQMFVGDNHYYPLMSNPGYSKGAYPENGAFWDEGLAKTLGVKEMDGDPQMKSVWQFTGVWRCPSAEPLHVVAGTDGRLVLPAADYGYNGLGLSRIGPNDADLNALGLGRHVPAGSPGYSPVRPSEVAQPAAALAIGDGFSGSQGVILNLSKNLSRNTDYNGNQWQPYLNYLEITKQSQARHQGHANVVYCDGHVESPSLSFLFVDSDDEALSRWNRDHLPHRELLQQ